jgi:hypothetical protein
MQKFIIPSNFSLYKQPKQLKNKNIKINQKQNQLYQKVFKVVWSTHYISIESRVNNTPYSQTNEYEEGDSSSPFDSTSLDSSSSSYHLFKKLSTFDGPPTFSQLNQITQPRLRQPFEDAINYIVRTIQTNQNNMKVRYLEAYFKLESNHSKPIHTTHTPPSHATLLYIRSLRCLDMSVWHSKFQSLEDRGASVPAPSVCFQCGLGIDLTAYDTLLNHDCIKDDLNQSHHAPYNKNHNHSANEEKEQNSSTIIITSSDRNRNRNSSSFNHPEYTPYQLASSVNFDLLSPISYDIAPSMRPRKVANALLGSPNINRRATQLIDKINIPIQDRISSSIRSPSLYQTQLNVYTSDSQRRRDLRIALSASRPQTASSGFRKIPFAPSISTVHRYLNTSYKKKFDPTRLYTQHFSHKINNSSHNDEYYNLHKTKQKHSNHRNGSQTDRVVSSSNHFDSSQIDDTNHDLSLPPPRDNEYIPNPYQSDVLNMSVDSTSSTSSPTRISMRPQSALRSRPNTAPKLNIAAPSDR